MEIILLFVKIYIYIYIHVGIPSKIINKRRLSSEEGLPNYNEMFFFFFLLFFLFFFCFFQKNLFINFRSDLICSKNRKEY